MTEDQSDTVTKMGMLHDSEPEEGSRFKAHISMNDRGFPELPKGKGAVEWLPKVVSSLDGVNLTPGKKDVLDAPPAGKPAPTPAPTPAPVVKSEPKVESKPAPKKDAIKTPSITLQELADASLQQLKKTRLEIYELKWSINENLEKTAFWKCANLISLIDGEIYDRQHNENIISATETIAAMREIVAAMNPLKAYIEPNLKDVDHE